MIRNQQKWIALLVTMTFIWLLQVSTMPLAATGTTEQVGSANAEQGPGYVEAVGQKYVPAPKKSILPYVFIGVGVVALAAVLFLVVLKTKYDIVGTWAVHITYDDHPNYDLDDNVTFAGDKKSGTTHDAYDGTGTYTIDGKNVIFNLHWASTNSSTYTGQFDGKDNMSGTFHEDVGYTGSWTAVRATSGTSLPKLKTTKSNRGPIR